MMINMTPAVPTSTGTTPVMPVVSSAENPLPATQSASTTQPGSGPIPGSTGTPMNMPAGVPESIPGGMVPIMMASTTSSTALSPDGTAANPPYHPLSNQNGAGTSIPSATARRMPMTDDGVGNGNGGGEMGMGMGMGMGIGMGMGTNATSHYGQREEGEVYNRDNIFPYVSDDCIDYL